MPLYECIVQDGQVAHELRPRIAAEITRIHCDATGAPVEFVQVVFTEAPEGSRFAGGEPSRAAIIRGQVRAGRGEEVHEEILTGLCDAWTDITGTTERDVMIALTEVPASQILEGGRIMPEPGQEDEWLAGAGAGDGAAGRGVT